MRRPLVAVGLEQLLHFVPPMPDLDAIHHLVDDDLPSADQLRGLLGEMDQDGPLEDLLCGDKGPRVRSMLVALSCRAVEEAPGRVDLEVQHAVELLHLALVLHDLTLGPRPEGRRRRLAKALFRHGVGILGGNMLTVRSLELARHASSPEVLGELVDTLGEISRGQAVARQMAQGAIPGAADWEEHADGHTGALFAFCCRAGAHLAQRGDMSLVNAVGRFGRHLGRAWHIAEDLAMVGQGDFQDWLERALAGRPALPIAEAASASPEFAVQWSDWVRRPERTRLDELAKLVADTDGPSRARRVLTREVWVARQALRRIPNSPYRSALDRLAANLARV